MDKKYGQVLIKTTSFLLSSMSQEFILDNLRTLYHLFLKTTTCKNTNTNNPICKGGSKILSNFPKVTMQVNGYWDSKIHSLLPRRPYSIHKNIMPQE